MDDLYPSSYSTGSDSTGYEEILSKMKFFDKELCKVRKKKKSEKKGGKKKLKKRLKALKKEHKKLQHFLNTFASQQKTVQSTPVWWQDALIKTLPKVIDMGTVVFNNITQPRPQVMPAKS